MTTHSNARQTPPTTAPPVGGGLVASHPPPPPTPQPRTVLCPYCGHHSLNLSRCELCKGYFDQLSQQASQNSMGPWFIREVSAPFRPGCSLATIKMLVERGRITVDTVVRGPSTGQFWRDARQAPGIAELLGICHQCGGSVRSGQPACGACGAALGALSHRDELGLWPVRPIQDAPLIEPLPLAARTPPIADAAGTRAKLLAEPALATRSAVASAPSFASSADRGTAHQRAIAAPEDVRSAIAARRRQQGRRTRNAAVLIGVACLLVAAAAAYVFLWPRFGSPLIVGETAPPASATPLAAQPAPAVAAETASASTQGATAPNKATDPVPLKPEIPKDPLAEAKALMETNTLSSLSAAVPLLERLAERGEPESVRRAAAEILPVAKLQLTQLESSRPRDSEQ
ncbi:MAG: hypothetical protein H7Y88_03505 [Phycisphaerales bacterium]|nr:hypothetical protein [Phycisphaerales bacterium]